MNVDDIQAGTIVRGHHPLDEEDRLAHYALIVSVERVVTGHVTITAAYGSSRKVSPYCHLPYEFVIVVPDELEAMSLRAPIRFDMRRTVEIMPDDITETVGHVGEHRYLLRRLSKAYRASM
ncbi:MAG TPA: hypothetical protein VFA48_06095 [Gammaproteobacteria bacterium]|nr:hypothetical protein [Gammaproteobacteria bacterium]